MVDIDVHKTLVIFRKYKPDGYSGDKNNPEILALFPGIDEGSGSCSCYQHLGQHGIANYHYCLDITVPALPEEYESLRKELVECFGYNLIIRKKWMRGVKYE